VKKTIQNSPSKSCPSDPIPTRTLSELLAPITIIVNSSLRSSVFPKVSKERRVLPFIKKETSILKFTRTFEKFWKGLLQARYVIILQRMAFTPVNNHRVQNDILRAIDDKNEVLLVLPDLSAAFNTLDHGVLISRLTGTVLSWFRSYLYGRSQRVVIKHAEPKSQPLTSGVPQGSVLGPLLFVLYFGPLQDIIKAHRLDCMIYADDSQRYSVLNPAARQRTLLNLELCMNDIHASSLISWFVTD